jgi:hypothetical protein
MPAVSDWKDVVRAAWNRIKGEVSSELPRAVLGKPLSDQRFNQGLGVCNLLNTGDTGGGSWGDDGQGTIQLTSVRVGDFTSVSAGPATIENLDVRLPLPFALLQASCRYTYEQPCAFYSFGKKGPPSKVNGAGTMNAKSEGGTLTYRLRVVDPDKALRLEMTGATVDGRRSVEVKPDSPLDSAFLRWLIEVFAGGLQERLIIKSALDSFFAHDQFSRDMVNELNRIIGATLAERAQG